MTTEDRHAAGHESIQIGKIMMIITPLFWAAFAGLVVAFSENGQQHPIAVTAFCVIMTVLGMLGGADAVRAGRVDLRGEEHHRQELATKSVLASLAGLMIGSIFIFLT